MHHKTVIYSKSRYIERIKIFQSPLNKTKAVLVAGSVKMLCVIGRNGTTHLKREGDGATPKGLFRLHRLWWRNDRGLHPFCGLQKQTIHLQHGWCDDVNSPQYNKLVKRPFLPSHEAMHRQDHVYNYVIEIGWNMHPVRRGRGSAIFLHLARHNFEPTAGCVAVPQVKIARLLAVIGSQTKIQIS